MRSNLISSTATFTAFQKSLGHYFVNEKTENLVQHGRAMIGLEEELERVQMRIDLSGF